MRDQIIRNLCKLYLPDHVYPLPLEPDVKGVFDWVRFWEPVTVQELVDTSPDNNGFVLKWIDHFKSMPSNTQGSEPTLENYAQFLGGIPVEEGCMWYCMLKSKGIVKIPSPPWDMNVLRDRALKFEKRFSFYPNPVLLIRQNELGHENEADWECPSARLEGAKERVSRSKG